jgi:hypothetical protein
MKNVDGNNQLINNSAAERDSVHGSFRDRGKKEGTLAGGWKRETRRI